jgi:hypothetical protein
MTCSTLELTSGDEPIMCSYGDGTWLTGFATGLTQPTGVDSIFLECHYDSGGPPLGVCAISPPSLGLHSCVRVNPVHTPDRHASVSHGHIDRTQVGRECGVGAVRAAALLPETDLAVVIFSERPVTQTALFATRRKSG